MPTIVPFTATKAEKQNVNGYHTSTDIALFVRTSNEDIDSFNKIKIVAALIRETGLPKETADKIADDVEAQIKASNIKSLSSSLIRELVNARLIEMGLEEEYRLHSRLGMPLYDVEKVIIHANKENANVPHNPEATNLTIAENVKKEFALSSVFSPDVTQAHLNGDIHLHDLGFIDRVYSFLGSCKITISTEHGIRTTSFRELFIELSAQYKLITDTRGCEIVNIPEDSSYCYMDKKAIPVYTADKEGDTGVLRILRHKIDGKRMLKITLCGGQSLVVTEDHPIMLFLNGWLPAIELTDKDELLSINGIQDKDAFSWKKIKIIEEYKIDEDKENTDDYIYDISTTSNTFFCNGIWVHNCSGQSLEYIKKFGLNLPGSLAIAKPAKHADVLLAHMVKFSASLQCNLAGAIGWDAVNLFFAPYLVGMSDQEIRQVAQMLVFEFSQQAIARGGQSLFLDININWEVPKHFEDVPAIGPGGTYTGKKYKDYETLAQKFAWALFDVYKEGDGCGRPFFFPKPLFHITDKFFKTDGHQEFLHHVCSVASEKGSPYFVFDRGDTARIAQCCRLIFNLEQQDLKDAKEPWKMRYTALQNITINLPRVAYKAKSTINMYEKLWHSMDLAAKAHTQKRKFISDLMALGENGPLALLAMNKDGESYLRLHRTTHLIGILGLNEMVQYHFGEQLHESPEAFKLGVKIISQMNLWTQQLSKQYGIKFILEQTPAESTTTRMARLDLKNYYSQAHNIVKGNQDSGEVYYTNSTQLNTSVGLNMIDRVKKEGIFHPLIPAGSITHLWIGEQQPSAEGLANFVTKVFRNTTNDQIAFSPEFTTCNACQRTTRGLHESCPICGSLKVDGITRITGYFTKISSWNKGKLGELKERYRHDGI